MIKLENQKINIRNQKINSISFVFLLFTFYFLLSAFILCPVALAIQPGQIELIIAKGCYLYDSGKLNEALAEFQAVLLKEPSNQAARDYVDKIWAKLNEKGKSSWELNEELAGYRNALTARKKIEINDQEKYTNRDPDQPYQRFINNTTIGYNDRHFEGSSDTSFYPDGFFVEEHLRLDTEFNDWKQAISMDTRYHDNSHEDARIRRLTYATSKDKVSFIAGDTSTRFSRYTLRGLYYRGADLSLKDDKNSFRILIGATPHFLTRTTANPNRDAGYIYPRKVFGVRDAYKATDNYTVGVSYMELRDSERVRTIDSNYDPKLNRVVSIDQNLEVIPHKWKIESENAYSTSDEDRTDQDILITDKKLKDFSHYVRSAIEIPKFKLINSYERLGPDFRSYADLASTNSNWLSAISADREKIDNYMEYRPFEFDPLYIDANFSRVRNNLDKDNDVEMLKQTNYGAGLRYVPEDDQWMPQTSVRLKYLDTLSVPGSQYASDDVLDRDIIFELAKRLYGVDLSTSYTFRKTIDNILTYGSYTNIYNISAAKELTDMVLLSTSYSRSNTTKDQNGDDGTIGRGNFFDINTALQLWAGANLSLGYSYQDDTDSTGITPDTKANIYSTTFSWPISKFFFKTGSELMLAPYFTYQLVDGWSSSNNKPHSIWTAALDASYFIAKDHRLSLNALYREDQNDNSSTYGTEDYRFLLTYQKIFN